MKLKITEGFGIPLTFKAGDLAPYLGDAELRAIPSKEGGNEPYWDGSMMTHISNMDEELNQESNTSKEADYSTEEEETGLQTEAQQGKEPTDEQLTLHTLHSPSKRDSEAMKDENGI